MAPQTKKNEVKGDEVGILGKKGRLKESTHTLYSHNFIGTPTTFKVVSKSIDTKANYLQGGFKKYRY